MNPHAKSIKPSQSALILLTASQFAAGRPFRRNCLSLSASGTSPEQHCDTTIPVGTPWTFEMIYNTASLDLDFE
jgi:hypothetical protein